MPFREDLKPERLVALEEEVLAAWDAEGTFAASLANRAGAKPWIFYDGPPTANGKPGIHHLISRSIKDFACRRASMRGFLVERKAGWDTHGLPVEFETEKRLGLEGKDAIERMGVAAFNKACRESVFAYLADWERFTRRSGYWVDLKDAYFTLSNDYVESLWAILAHCHERGLLYRGHKVLPYCPRCGTALSSHEVGLGFKDVQDPSVTVRFRALDEKGAESGESFLVWTTTPWTLPANVALAVHPDVDYVKVRVAEAGGASEVLWIAAPRLEPVLSSHKAFDVELLERVKGSALVGRRYRRLLDLYDVASAPNAFTVRPADFVTTEDGTGIVHMAPAYGEDDAAVGRRDALPVLHPVDARGRFKAGPRADLVAGKFVKDADKDVLRHLKQEGLLFRHETVVHAYPHCWRCDTPLLYYARECWYLRTTRVKDRMIEFNRATRWFPESTGSGRMGEWLENNVDWAVSRERYWGTPLPVWVCDQPNCRKEVAVRSVADLMRRAGRLPEPLDLHRPHVDDLVWPCDSTNCDGILRRTPEVVDCWFDSGSMPYAQWHYPFENRERVEREVPADFVAEGVDQTRGWFYTLLAVSTMYRDRPAYRVCVSNDMVLDAKGKKMSKSRGNVVDPADLVSRHGADVVRWHLLTSRAVWLPRRFDERDLVEVRNRLFGTLLHTYQFFAMYANVDGFGTVEGLSPAAPPSGWRPKGTFDRWLLSRLAGLVAAVDADLEEWETAKAGKRIAEFVVEDLSNWYVRRNRRRIWRGALDDDKRDAYRTMHAALLTVARLMAPFSPFLSDAVHRALLPEMAGAGASVHLADWPSAAEFPRDEALEERMEAVRTVVSLGHAARNRAGLKVRQPLARVTTGHASADVVRFLEENRAVVAEELNVKAVEIVRGFETSADLKAALAKKEAAPRLGPKTKPVEDALAALPSAEVARLAAAFGKGGTAPVRIATGEVVALSEAEVRLTVVDAAGGASEYAHGILVRLDTTVTPALKAESLARELVHALQALRKQKGFQVTDRVRVTCAAAGDLAAAMRAHRAYVAEEILATDVTEVASLDPTTCDRIEVDGNEAFVAIEAVPAAGPSGAAAAGR